MYYFVLYMYLLRPPGWFAGVWTPIIYIVWTKILLFPSGAVLRSLLPLWFDAFISDILKVVLLKKTRLDANCW